ncbi:hypothetical protein [Aurantibacter sp.]|uniref:hypothetical protein n=1 Tax=Aurantibacter sp. TaxID=2807103 RepID=UPI0035C7B898
MKYKRLPELIFKPSTRSFLVDGEFEKVMNFFTDVHESKFEIADCCMLPFVIDYNPMEELRMSKEMTSRELFAFFDDLDVEGFPFLASFDYLYLESVDKKSRVIIDDSCSVTVISFNDKALGELFNSVIKPYEEVSLHQKINNTYSAFFEKSIADTFTKTLIENYFKKELVFLL